MKDSEFDLELEIMKAHAYLQQRFMKKLQQEQQRRLAESFDPHQIPTKSS